MSKTLFGRSKAVEPKIEARGPNSRRFCSRITATMPGKSSCVTEGPSASKGG